MNHQEHGYIHHYTLNQERKLKTTGKPAKKHEQNILRKSIKTVIESHFFLYSEFHGKMVSNC